MATITLSNYARTNLGVPVGGLRIRAYALNLDGTVGASHVAETSTNSTTGEWELVNLDTTTSPTGMFAVEQYNPSTQESRWQMGDIRLQVGYLTGPHGEAPLNDGAVTSAKIADGAVTDAKVGTRTPDPALAAPASTGTLSQLLSWITGRLKAITGTSNWFDTPPTTLTAAAAHAANTANPHATTADQVGAVTRLGGVISAAAGNDANKGAPVSGAMYVARDTQSIYLANGSAWSLIGTSNYNNLTNKPSGGVSPHTHSGTDITSAVGDANALKGQQGGMYPRLGTVSGFANSGANLTSTTFKMMAGSVSTPLTNGNGTIHLPVTVNGYATIVASNGDYDAYNDSINLKDSYAGADSRFTVRAATNFSGAVRVNYIIIYW